MVILSGATASASEAAAESKERFAAATKMSAASHPDRTVRNAQENFLGRGPANSGSFDCAQDNKFLFIEAGAKNRST